MKIDERSRPLVIIFLVAIVYYVSVHLRTYNNIHIANTGDAQEYLTEADNILRHQTTYCGNLAEENLNPALYSRRPPLYPLLIAVLTLLFGNQYTILSLQIGLTFSSAFLILKILELQHVSMPWKIGITLGFLFYPSQLIYTNFVMAEILQQFMLVLATYFFARYSVEKRSIHLLYFNLCLTCAVFTKPIWLYFGIINVLLHGGLFFRTRKKELILFSVIFIVAISGWSYRNYRKTGVFHFSSIRVHNLLNYNLRGFLAKQSGLKQADIIIEDIENSANALPTFKDSYHYSETKSYQLVRKNAISYAFFHIRGVLNFFIDPGRFDLINFLQIKNSKSLSLLFQQYGYSGIFRVIRELPLTVLFYFAVMIILNTLLLISIIRYGVTPQENCTLQIFILIVIFYIAILTGPIGASRFRLPIYPLMLLTVPFFCKVTKK